jgi:hypothetical protein
LLISWKRNSSPFPKPLSKCIVSPQFLVVIINVYYEAEE